MNVKRAKDMVERITPAAESPRLANVPLRVLSQHECPFFEDRQATLRGVYALKKFGRYYSDLLEQGYWRRTDVVEKPVCRECKACQAIRVPVNLFEMSRSQKRCWKRNRDLTVEVIDYKVDAELLELFRSYLIGRHGWGTKAGEERLEPLIDWYAHRLGRSPVKCKAFKYRLDGKLVGLSVCDDSKGTLYSAFFAYDLAEMKRGLGNFSVLYELEWCRAAGKTYYYMANLIEGFEPSDYKMAFRPYEVRGDDGVWRRS